MNDFLKLPYPYPQLAEALAMDNDEVAVYFMKLALLFGCAKIYQEVLEGDRRFPDSRRELLRELGTVAADALSDQEVEVSRIIGMGLLDEPPF